MLDDLPTKWERHDDMLLIPASAFVRPEWATLDQSTLWQAVAKVRIRLLFMFNHLLVITVD
jgi:hypothetical protein